MKQISRLPSAIKQDVVHNDKHIHRIQEMGNRGRTWITYITYNVFPQDMGLDQSYNKNW